MMPEPAAAVITEKTGMGCAPPNPTDSADFTIAPLTGKIFDEALALWKSAEGVVLRPEDYYRPAFEQFLFRNPGLSWGAWRDGKLIGALMAGQDGRRGYIYHLAVAFECRRRGIGRALVAKVERGLAEQGICKAHTHVVNHNLRAQLFWMRLGWVNRDDIATFSCPTIGS